MVEAGWHVDGVDVIESWRRVTPDDLWTWVSQALPLRTTDGTVLGAISEVKQNEIRTELQSRLADRVDPGGYLTLPMHGWLVRAQN